MGERTYSIKVNFVDAPSITFSESSLGKDLFASKLEDDKSVWIDVPNDANGSVHTVRKESISRVIYKDITDTVLK